MSYFDFNDASEQNSFELIPKGTVLKVRMTFRPGAYDDPAQGWVGGYATRNPKTGAIYLDCEFVVLEGEFAKRKLWSLIGLYSPKGPEWGNMGRTVIKAVLNSARRIHPNDTSPAAQNARRISGFHELDGIEFVARVDWEKDQNDQFRNVVKFVVTPDQPEYAAVMNGTPPGSSPAPAHPSAPNTYAQATGRAPAPTNGARPAWAQ